MNLTPIYDPPEKPKPHPICLLMPSANSTNCRALPMIFARTVHSIP